MNRHSTIKTGNGEPQIGQMWRSEYSYSDTKYWLVLADQDKDVLLLDLQSNQHVRFPKYIINESLCWRLEY